MQLINSRPKSVMYESDGRAIDNLVCIHCETDSPRIADVTYNKGRMWRDSYYKPDITMDIHTYDVTCIGDFSMLPFASNVFDVIVYDPPHLPSSAASTNSSRMWEDRYGITDDVKRRGDNVSELFHPFFIEAKRVLVYGGIALCKIADIVHNHRYQWQHIDLFNAAVGCGLTPCDLLIRTTKAHGNLKSSKWKNVYHLRRAHSYWMVIRNGYDERKIKQKRCMGG